MEESQSEQSSSPNFVAIEKEILSYWNSQGTFNKLRQQKKGAPFFRFLDGPVTANNPIGVHHAWGRTLKDVFIRYKNLRGFNSGFQNGFDCQGLWVEVEVEKELGFKGKPDIEAFGLDRFSEACKARVEKFSAIQTQQSIRLGQWMDWDDSYYTHSDKNIEGIWKFLKTCAERGWLYQSGLPMPWCTRCGTSLSEHEMTGSYKTVKHLAVFIKLLLPEKDARILVWTTTPWTLPANTALAVNPELTYLKVLLETTGEKLILGKDVVDRGFFGKKAIQVLESFKGEALVGLQYEPVFPELEVQKKFSHRIVSWSDVDPKEGTGVVHIAPGCGRDDFELSKKVELVRLSPVDERGIYGNDYGPLAGKQVAEVGPEIEAYLKQNNKLHYSYQHEHSYPICWRCKEDLIFRLVDEWYISSNEIRPQLIEAARQVDWQPAHIGKRMEDWLKNMGDWCISRKRFWGLPLPFYLCSCGKLTVIGSRAELQEKSSDSLSSLRELHRPWIDAFEIQCPACQKKVKRVSEVGDCWLDAGITPFTTKGCYDEAGVWGQADWVCEMSEQVRLWFYSMLYMSVALSGKSPYKKVTTHERVLSEEGTKFSKTGHMIRLEEAAEQMGIDTMRYHFAGENPNSDVRFGYKLGDEARKRLIALWNIFAFFQTYAKIDRPVLSDEEIPADKLSIMDQSLMAALQLFVTQAENSYDSYYTPSVVRSFEQFAEIASNWYIRSNRRRFWKSENDQDKLAGYQCLFKALKVCTIILSPIVPMVTEKIWQNGIRAFQNNAPESVHLAKWPEISKEYANEALLNEVLVVQKVITLAHRLRSESQKKVRQPLAVLYVRATDAVASAIKRFEEIILAEINVKKIALVSESSNLEESVVEVDLKQAGPILKGSLPAVVAAINALSQSDGQRIALEIESGKSEIEIPNVGLVSKGALLIRKKSRSGIVSGEEHGIFAALDTTLSAELEEEGWIRDILRQSQVLRKDSGLDVADRIILAITTDSERLKAAVTRHKKLIEDETLGELREVVAAPQGETSFSLSGGAVKVLLEKT